MFYRKVIRCFSFAAFYLLTILCSAQNEIEKGGTFDYWRVRKIKESGIIGGHIKYLYVIAPQGDTIVGANAYRNSHGWVCSSTNVLAIVKGIVKTSCTVFPEVRGNGHCVRLETRMERVTALGIINMHVIASGTIFLGSMIEPIRNTDNPQSKLDCGIPYSKKPNAISFDYKVNIGVNRVRASGFGGKKELHDNDYAECVVMLQKRWEDANGKVYAKRIGTAFKRFTTADVKSEWTDGYTIPIMYGNITKESSYRSYMGLIPAELSNYMINSKGKSVPIIELGWGDPDDIPTHIIIRFSSSYGEAYVGDPSNKLWIDNVKLIEKR